MFNINHIIFLVTGQILGVVPYCKSQPPAFKYGIELLGIKWLPSLSLQHAKEITPYEVGEPAWKPSLQKLTSGMVKQRNCNFLLEHNNNNNIQNVYIVLYNLQGDFSKVQHIRIVAKLKHLFKSQL